MLLLVASSAQASPPSPDSDTNCGGHCQAICINGCDTNPVYVPKPADWGTSPWYNTPTPSYSRYSWTEARCVVSKYAGYKYDQQLGSNPTTGTDQYRIFDRNRIYRATNQTVGWYDYCHDGYSCDAGPCGRVGERPCQPNGCPACGVYTDDFGMTIRPTFNIDTGKCERRLSASN